MTAALGAGSVFAGYRVERVLGAGGMGTVYLARNPDLPRFEAIKVLSAELSRDPEFRARFVREADVAAALDHPNVVEIYGRGDFEGQLWIAMQFVDGTDADEALREGAMTPVRAVHLVTEVAKALDYAHDRNVVHRDVKPANFLLSGPVGPEERVLLGDFGIARALDDANLTATGSFMATVSYAAPEVLAGQPFDGRADLYSLGCTLFRLLSGEPPFASANGMPAVIAAHLHAPPPRVSDRVPDLSMRMDEVIIKAMAKDPAARFASARKFAAAAAQALGDEHPTVVVRPVPGAVVAPYAPQPTAGGTRPWQQPGSPATYPPPGYGPAHFPPGPPPAPRPRRGRWIAALAAVVVLAAATVGVTFLARSQHRPTSAPESAASKSTTTTPTTGVAPSALLGLLLSPEQAAEILGAPDMTVTQSLNAIHDDASWTIVEKDCLGALLPAQRIVYADTGWRGAQEQGLKASAGGMGFTQAVISYPSAEAARKVVAEQEPQWAACSGRTVSVHQMNSNPDAHFAFGPLIHTDGTRSMTQTSEDFTTNNVGCQRALAARSNVVIDVAVCRPDVGNQGVDVLNEIASKIPK